MTSAFVWPFTKLDSKSHSEKLFKRAQTALLTGDLKQAEEHLHQLLKQLHHDDTAAADYVGQRARVMSELGNIALLRGDHQSAERLFKQATQDCVHAGTPITDAMLVEFSLKLAILYAQLERFEEAHLGFQFCIRTQEDKMTDDGSPPPAVGEEWNNESALLGMSYNYYADFLFCLGLTSEALDYARKSFRVASQLYPPDHHNCLNLLCNMAAMEHELGHLEVARQHLSEAQTRGQNRVTLLLLESRESGDALDAAQCLFHILLERASLEASHGEREESLQRVQAAELLIQQFDRRKLNVDRLVQFRSEYKL